MLLLSDQVEEAARRDKEALEVGKEVERGRKRVGEEVNKLLGGDRAGQAEKNTTPETSHEEEGKGEKERGPGEGDDRMELDKVDIEPVAQERQKEEENQEDDRMEAEAEDEDEDEDEGFEQVA